MINDDILRFFGLSANRIKQTKDRNFVTSEQLMAMGGVPKLTNDQMNAYRPSGPTIIYNTTVGAFFSWNGYEWENMNSTLAASSEEIQKLINEAVRKKEGYDLSKNDFSDLFKSMLNECYLWRHQRNKDTKLAEGGKSEITAVELREHLDKHPKGLTLEQEADLLTIKNKVDKEENKFLMSQEQADSLAQLLDKVQQHIEFHPVTVIQNGETVQALTPEQVELINSISNKVNKKFGYDLISIYNLEEINSKIHDKDKDNYLARGTLNEVSAAEIKKFMNDIEFSGITEEERILWNSITDKCDKPELGWGFSQNNFTNEEKTLLQTLKTTVEELSSRPTSITQEQVDLISTIEDKVSKVAGLQLTEENFTKDFKDFIEDLMINGAPTGGGGTVEGLSPEQKQLLAQLALRKQELDSGYHFSEENFTAFLKQKLVGMTESNLTVEQLNLIDSIADKCDKPETGWGFSQNNFSSEYKESIDDIKLKSHSSGEDDRLGKGTPFEVTAQELREHIDNGSGGGGAGIATWTPATEFSDGMILKDPISDILYEVKFDTEPFKVTTSSNIEDDLRSSILAPIFVVGKLREWRPNKLFFKDELVKHSDGKLYFSKDNAISSLTFEEDLESGKFVVTGGGHDKDKDAYLDKDGDNQVSAKEIRELIDAASILPGIPNWQANTKYMDNQPLVDSLDKNKIYRVVAKTSPYYIISGSSVKADVTEGKLELLSEAMIEELKAHIMSTQDDGNSYVNTTTKIGITTVPATITINNNINDDNKNIVQVWKVQETGTTDITTIVKDFNNSDVSNFEGDVDKVVFDGSMYQKDTLLLTPVSLTALGSGFVSEFEPINTSGMLSVVSIKAVKS